MKRLNLLALAAMFACTGAFIACEDPKEPEIDPIDDPETVAVTGIEFGANSGADGISEVGDGGVTATLTIAADGNPVILRPTVLPVNATNKNITWTSSNPEAATVAKGIVSPVAEGETTITATTVDGGFEAKCKVTVLAPEPPEPTVPVEDMRISRSGATILIGQTITIIATILPEGAPQEVTFTSNNTAVATVTAEGLVTAVSNGNADITVTSVGLTAAGEPVYRISNITVSDEIGRRCLTGTPEWGETLGEPYFASDQTWDLGGVVWSDAVEITGGETKLTYDGGNHNTGGYKSDFRHNPDSNYKGDFFSWCAVVRHQEVLCPDEWRVPTVDDFVALDKALGGNGTNQTGTQIVPKYLSDWGGQLAGWVPYDSPTKGNPIYSPEVNGMYWTANEYNEYEGNLLLLGAPGGSNQPLNHTGKGVGSILRCVKDI